MVKKLMVIGLIVIGLSVYAETNKPIHHFEMVFSIGPSNTVNVITNLVHSHPLPERGQYVAIQRR